MDASIKLSDNANKAQAYLFAEGGTLSYKKLSQLLDADHEQVMRALDELAKQLDGSGLCIIRGDSDATLAVAPRESEALRAQYEKELGAAIGEAGLEVLAIVLYRGPSTRADIDYIRGVNTSSTMRTLLARGLIERSNRQSDGQSAGREYVYGPTVELLAHIGAQTMQDVPEYGTISNELQAFETRDKDTGPFNQQQSEENSDRNNKQEYARNTADTDGGSAFAGNGADDNAGDDSGGD
jgi:segregation and condensation protein B